MKAEEVYADSLIGGVESHILDYWRDWQIDTKLLPTGCRVLDIGAGTGLTSKQIKSYNTNNYVVSTDVSSRSVAEFEKLLNDRFIDNFYKCDIVEDIDNLKHAENKFDHVMVFETLEHLSSPYHAINNIKSLCKWNGLIHISVPDFDQQCGYKSNQHAFVYPGLFVPQYFQLFLMQMYLRVEFYIPFHHKSTYSIRDDRFIHGVSYRERPLHHYYICRNLEIQHDILKVVNTNFGDPKHDLYNFI